MCLHKHVDAVSSHDDLAVTIQLIHFSVDDTIDGWDDE